VVKLSASTTACSGTCTSMSSAMSRTSCLPPLLAMAGPGRRAQRGPEGREREAGESEKRIDSRGDKDRRRTGAWGRASKGGVGVEQQHSPRDVQSLAAVT
jgi:hypothetical protein